MTKIIQSSELNALFIWYYGVEADFFSTFKVRQKYMLLRNSLTYNKVYSVVSRAVYKLLNRL